MVVRIARKYVPKDTVQLARWLLGKVVVRKFRRRTLSGRIVETEAYLQDDPACHGFRGQTARNRSLFLERGHAYVYLCYGTSYMLNMSSEGPGIGTGVLIRALEPLQGIEHMGHRREHVALRDLTRGPGRLTAALNIDLQQDGLDLMTAKELWIGQDEHSFENVGESVRIGLTKGADLRLRFFIADSNYLSGSKRLNTLRLDA
jgi:DNA-3-methyladenine glycosylase